MPFLSDFAELELLDALVGNGSYNTTAPHLSLHDDIPGETGANEVTGGSYARQPLTWNAAAAGSVDNSSQEDFTSMPAVTITHAGLWDALTVGNFLASIPLGAGARVFATALASTDVFTSYAHGFSNDDRVQLRASIAGDLPTGLSESVLYHIVGVTTDTFQISLTQGGAAVNGTTDGEVLVAQVEPRVVNSGDTVQFPTTNVTLTLD
jgi:hypothetical protein